MAKPLASDLQQRDAAQDWTSIDRLISQVLRCGVLISAAIIALGVALYLAQGSARAILFAPASAALRSTDPRSVRDVFAGVGSAQPAGVTDLGLLVLLVTPVVSVGIAVLAFARMRDWLYVAIAGFVFAMLMLSFAIGSA
jgi:uncharacterized membrane protein